MWCVGGKEVLEGWKVRGRAGEGGEEVLEGYACGAGGAHRDMGLLLWPKHPCPNTQSLATPYPQLIWTSWPLRPWRRHVPPRPSRTRSTRWAV